MFDWEELSQTVDKSEQGRPDRAGQPLEATAEGQVSQLLLCSTRGGDIPPSAFGVRVRVAAEVRVTMLHFMTTSLSAHLAPHPLPTLRKPSVVCRSKNPHVRHQLKCAENNTPCVIRKIFYVVLAVTNQKFKKAAVNDLLAKMSKVKGGKCSKGSVDVGGG